MPQRSKEQLLAELIRMQKELEKTLGVQEHFIKSFQLLVQDDGVFAQVIDSLPCPVAVFKRDGVLCMANRVLITETDIQSVEISAEKINFLNRVTDDNYGILEAAEDVFFGKTAFLKQLSYPLALFCRNENYIVSNALRSALLFPVPDRRGYISFGVIMLMK